MQSLSEIDTTSKRASKAAGFSWGVSEEIGKAIRSLRLHRDGKGQNIQWRYQCCVPGTGRYLPMPQKKVLIGGTHHMKHQRKIPGSQIPWSNPNHFTISYWIKTNPATGHWRSIFRWGNDGSRRSPAAWLYCCRHSYKYHFRVRTERCCGTKKEKGSEETS